VRVGDANAVLPGLVDQAPADTTTVVYHSAFPAHLPQRARLDFEQLVPALSQARTIV
jgi:hypothetical protein